MNIFLKSALAHSAEGTGCPDAMEWFRERQANHHFNLEQIPFTSMRDWSFDSSTGNLVHQSGRFFSIEGIHVQTNWGTIRTWEQPIINQPEIGFLGFITKAFGGVLHFLVQAKMEPGNINMIQLAPTLQATRSNFTQVHKGKAPSYLEYFMTRKKSRVLVDSLQSEQGARFLRKRNRNIIIEVVDDIPVYDDYCWMTLGQILQTMRHDNIVNMDARTVLSCIPYEVADELPILQHAFGRDLIGSFANASKALHCNEAIISWFTEHKFKYELEVEKIPLHHVRCWEKTDHEIRHESGKFFSVMAFAVEADNREVSSWTQPLVKAHQQGLIAFVAKAFNGVLHFLVQAKVEPGNFDVVEMAPTVQCLTGSYEQVAVESRPPFVNYVLHAQAEQRHVDSLQSEEGAASTAKKIEL